MKIGILGSRGIPNYYGGFEEFAQQLAVRLVKMGHQVWVYNSHRHPFDQKTYQGVEIIHKYDAEHRMGTAGQFIYDFNCILDARSREFEILLCLGYTSSSIWQRFMPKQSIIITNMDGLEWRRSKYSDRVKKYLKWAEKWAANGSNLLVADSMAIKEYLERHYSTEVVYVPYGAKRFNKRDNSILDAYNVEAGAYNLVVARLEPENNLAIILEGIQKSNSPKVTLVVGNHETPYGEYLKKKYKDNRIRFIKGTFNKDKINNLRYYCHLYLHGHSVGGTNPSLLEAMACGCMIAAHQNPFNREVLKENASYFLDATDVANILDHQEKGETQMEQIKNNYTRLAEQYDWKLVAEQYEVVFQQALIGKR